MTRRRIQGKRALITGASSGIGCHLALELARQGADLVLLARRAERLAAVADEVQRHGRRAEVVVGDVTDQAVRHAALARAESELGGLDLLINNAGVSAHGRFTEAGPERLRTIMEVNFFAAAELIRAALPLLRAGREPMVVNVASILGHRGIPHNSEYCASKFALVGLSQSLRAELATIGIDVLVASPGPTETEFFEHLIDRQGDLPWKQANRAAAADVARAIIRAIARGKHQIVPSRRGQLLLWLNRLSPRLVDRLMRRYG